jgi:beta-glucosidase
MPLISLFLYLSACTRPDQPADPIVLKIQALLQQMTLDEKVGQMNQYNGFWEVTGPASNEGNANMKYGHLKKGLVGAVLNVKGVENVRKLQEIVVKESRLGIPLLFGFDVIHGHKTLFPIPLGEAASWDLAAIEKSARVAAIEASAVGINWTFAPMVDISRDARWGRVMEVAQLYIRDKVASIVRPVKELKGFQKFSLQPDESRVVEFVLTDAELGFYTVDGDFITEPGEFDIMVGTNSQEGLQGKFTIK